MLVYHLELRFDEGEGGELKNYETWFGFALAMGPQMGFLKTVLAWKVGHALKRCSVS